jgi:hypothetical protein
MRESHRTETLYGIPVHSYRFDRNDKALIISLIAVASKPDIGATICATRNDSQLKKEYAFELRDMPQVAYEFNNRPDEFFS